MKISKFLKFGPSQAVGSTDRGNGRLLRGSLLRGSLLRGKWISLFASLWIGAMIQPLDAVAELTLKFDPAIEPQESEAIRQDIEQLRNSGIQGNNIRYFEKVFGGPGGPDVERYLGERLKVIVSEKTDVEGALKPLTSLMSSFVTSSMAQASPQPQGDSDEPRTIATNIGSAIFFLAVEKSLPGIALQLGSESIEVRSTRAGVIQLGRDYVDGLSSAIRINALVHEARHSDCTGGLSDADKASLRSLPLVSENGSDPAGSEETRATSNLCAHAHVKCPPGHSYAGSYACDDHPWGAYSVDAVFAAAIALECENCTSQSKAVAEAIFADSAIRYPEFEKMVQGELGDPDMSHTEVSLP